MEEQGSREAKLLARIGKHFSAGELEQTWQAWCNTRIARGIEPARGEIDDRSKYNELIRAMDHLHDAVVEGTDPNDYPRSAIINLLIDLEKDDERRTSGKIAEAIAEVSSALSELRLI